MIKSLSRVLLASVMALMLSGFAPEAMAARKHVKTHSSKTYKAKSKRVKKVGRHSSLESKRKVASLNHKKGPHLKIHKRKAKVKRISF